MSILNFKKQFARPAGVGILGEKYFQIAVTTDKGKVVKGRICFSDLIADLISQEITILGLDLRTIIELRGLYMMLGGKMPITSENIENLKMHFK